MIFGKIVTFHAVEGLGYIEPDGGGPQVLVHADEWGGDRDIVPGTPVRFSTIQGSGGLRAYNVMILESAAARDREVLLASSRKDDGRNLAVDIRSASREPSNVQVLNLSDYVQEITNVVISAFPGVSTTQIIEACSEIAMRAAEHGWLAC